MKHKNIHRMISVMMAINLAIMNVLPMNVYAKTSDAASDKIEDMEVDKDVDENIAMESATSQTPQEGYIPSKETPPGEILLEEEEEMYSETVTPKTEDESVLISTSDTVVDRNQFYESVITDSVDEYFDVIEEVDEGQLSDAEEKLITGVCGTDLEWNLDIESGSLVISGSGDMSNYTSSPWENYSDDIKSIRINDGVTSIGSYAFSELKEVETVKIANSVTSIGFRAFCGCIKLSEINIPLNWNSCPKIYTSTEESNSNICGHIFEGCSSLKEIILPEGMATLPAYAFNGSESLISVNCQIH